MLVKQTFNSEWLGVMLVVAWVWTCSMGCQHQPRQAPICMAGATLGDNGECRQQLAPSYRIPFEMGYQTKILQGFHGQMTHDKEIAYAVDLDCEAGTPVVASHRGRVLATRENSTRGCSKASCLDDANYVILDHGNGSYTEYYHLQPESVVVSPGESVCRGEVLGLCGNTGYSTAPHLHFAATDLAGRTMPVRFEETQQTLSGFPVPGSTITSENRLTSQCQSTPHSKLSTTAFAHRGVTLNRPLPVIYDSGPEDLTISGRYHGDRTHVAVVLQHKKNGQRITSCKRLADAKQFAMTVGPLSPGEYLFLIGGTDKNCEIGGWGYRLFVR